MKYDNKKILIIGSKRDGSLELSYRTAFALIGIRAVDHIDPEEKLRMLIRNRAISRFIKPLFYTLAGKTLNDHLQSNNRYDVVIVFKGGLLTPTTLSRAKKLSAKSVWININPDDPFNFTNSGSTNRNIVNSIPLFNIYATWSKRLIEPLRTHGCDNVCFLPFGYNPDWHYPVDTHDERLKDTISFVGCWDKNREQILTSLADFPLAIYGDFWDRISSRSPLRRFIHPYNIYGDKLRSVISSSRASLNILRPQNYGAHNMRTFEIPAMGGLMITTRSEEQEAYFPSGRASLSYTNIDELREMVKRVLSDEDFAEAVKRNAYALRAGNSYRDRAEFLLSAI